MRISFALLIIGLILIFISIYVPSKFPRRSISTLIKTDGCQISITDIPSEIKDRRELCKELCYEHAQREMSDGVERIMYNKSITGDVDLYHAKRDLVRYKYLCNEKLIKRTVNREKCGFSCEFVKYDVFSCSNCYYAKMCLKICNNPKDFEYTLKKVNREFPNSCLEQQIAASSFIQRCWTNEYPIKKRNRQNLKNFQFCHDPEGKETIIPCY